MLAVNPCWQLIHVGFIYKLKQFPTAHQRSLSKHFSRINFYDVIDFHVSTFVEIEPSNTKGCTEMP